MKKIITLMLVLSIVAGCKKKTEEPVVREPVQAQYIAPDSKPFARLDPVNANAWCINGTVWLMHVNGTGLIQMMESNLSDQTTPVACAGGIKFPIPVVK